MVDVECLFGARKETLERLKDLYSRSYFGDERLNKLRAVMYLQEIERIKKHFDFFPGGGRILDIGCGRGEFLSLFDNTWEKYGIEISDYAREVSNKNGIITDFKLQDNFFDIIVFRGTIQHIPDPVHKIEEAYYWLKKEGGVVFLSTPNTNSIVYRLFRELPMINPQFNFLLPSDKMIEQILSNFGFTEIEFEYPYIGTPYARPLRDIISFILRLLRVKEKVDFPFYGNVVECYARKR